MDIILAIATLCQVNYGGSKLTMLQHYEERTLDCQKYYIKCITNKLTENSSVTWNLKKCIMQREVK